MSENQWKCFEKFRDEMKSLCKKWSQFGGILYPLQNSLAQNEKKPYAVQNSVVYNSDYDRVQKSDEILYIVVGDNPGKEEQMQKNLRYLVGQSGRLAEGIFRRNAELGADFRKNVIVLNKTPVHTAKTVQLKTLEKNGGAKIQALLRETQIKMAELCFFLHDGLAENSADEKKTRLWLVGYSEMKKNGIFSCFRDELFKLYRGKNSWQKVFVFQHFSMNCFQHELNQFMKKNPQKNFTESLEEIGMRHKSEIF
jgi:hypothetical protein